MCVISQRTVRTETFSFLFVRGKITLLTERLDDFSNGEVALSTNVLVRGGVLWSKIVFCCFIGDVCVCSD